MMHEEEILLLEPERTRTARGEPFQVAVRDLGAAILDEFWDSRGVEMGQPLLGSGKFALVHGILGRDGAALDRMVPQCQGRRRRGLRKMIPIHGVGM